MTESTEQEKRTILLVDTSSEQRKQLLRTIQAVSRYTVKEARSGREALEMMAQHNVDLVISELLMPVMDGLTLLQEVRTHPRLKGTAFILMAEKPPRDIAEISRSSNVASFFTKPVSEEVVASALQRLFSPPELPDLSSLSALVVDDLKSARKVVIRHLQELGVVKVTEATNGLEAIGQLTVGHFDLIISDSDMPKLGGAGVHEQLRKSPKWRSTPFLLISSSHKPVAAVENDDRAGFLAKPFTARALREQLVKFFGKARK